MRFLLVLVSLFVSFSAHARERIECTQGAGIFRHVETGQVITFYSAEDRNGAAIIYGLANSRPFALMFSTGSNAIVYPSVQAARATGPVLANLTHEPDTYQMFWVHNRNAVLPQGRYDMIGCRE